VKFDVDKRVVYTFWGENDLEILSRRRLCSTEFKLSVSKNTTV